MVFPKWTNRVLVLAGVPLVVSLGLATFAVYYWGNPRHTDVGYNPVQPIAFSHRLHAGDLAIDCRYCHKDVEKAAHANLPSSETCLNCHRVIKPDSPEIAKIKKSFDTKVPIHWIKVHRLPDYAYFDHSRHVNSGVSCVSCHGRVDQMETVHQVEPLSMGWCLDCHRAPEKHLRPKEFVTKLGWSSTNQIAMGLSLKSLHHINPGQDCSLCHH